MKLLIFISYLIGAALLLACQNGNPNLEDKTDSNNSEILSLVFDTLVEDKESWKSQLLPIPVPLDSEGPNYHVENKRQKHEMDSIYFKLDTAAFFVFVNDSLAIPAYNLDIIRSLSGRESFKANFPDVDISKRQLLVRLAENTSSKHFDLRKMNSRYSYKLKYLSSKRTQNKDLVVIGNVAFSQITYNKNKTAACIYSELVCGGLCGYGNIYFLEKHDKKWEIVAKRNLWVA